MAAREPFEVRREGGVLFAVLDSPSSSVNVFGPSAAAQLDRILDALEGVELLVLASRKPGSFVNGAGLLYATAMTSRRQARRVSAPVRRVYERLASAPVPTVAVIEGNCFGCGLELALACRRRIGRDVAEASFRMTELADYRFVPLFGGTWRLPRTVGEAAAAELLLGGARWSAREAHRRGLLDVLLPDDGFDVRLSQVLEAERRAPGAARAAPRTRIPARLIRVPPPAAGLWSEAAELLRRARELEPRRARAAEVSAFVRTVTSQTSKRASAFFFVRQMARSLSLGDVARHRPDVRLVLPAREPLRKLLSPPMAHPPARAVRAAVGRPAPVEVRLGWSAASAVPGVLVCFPLGCWPGALCELAAPPELAALAMDVARYLEWVGFEPVRTVPLGGALAFNRLAARYLGALAELVLHGAPPAAVNRALWNAGMCRLPAALLADGGAPLMDVAAGGNLAVRAALRRLAAAGRDSRPWPGTLDVVTAALASEAADCVAEGVLLHLAQADLLARLLLDFPLEEGSVLLRADREGLAQVFSRARRAGWQGRVPHAVQQRIDASAGLYR